MKNLIILAIAVTLASFTYVNDKKFNVEAKMDNGDLLVHIDNRETVDLNLKILVYDANGKKLVKRKEHLDINTSNDFHIIAEGEDGFELPLTVVVKGKGRNKAEFIKVVQSVKVKE